MQEENQEKGIVVLREKGIVVFSNMARKGNSTEHVSMLKCRVAYIAPSGCVYVCLPIFVDVSGTCHNSVDAESVKNVTNTGEESHETEGGPLSPQDMFIDRQFSMMRDTEKRKMMMASVLEEMMQRVREKRRMKARSKLQALTQDKYAEAGAPRRVVIGKEAIIRELWNDHQCQTAARTEATMNSASKNYLMSRCGFSPRSKKNKPFHLQQPRASVY
jgi:hypothetical protein